MYQQDREYSVNLGVYIQIFVFGPTNSFRNQPENQLNLKEISRAEHKYMMYTIPINALVTAVVIYW